MKKTFIYFYKITNLINNKYYYGVHKTNNIDDGYMGSGKRLKYAFSKYGVGNFKKEILEYFNIYEDALKYESEIVSEKLVNDNNCYNLKIGGAGGNGWVYANIGEKMITVIDKNKNKYIRVNVDSEYFRNKKNYKHLTQDKIFVRDESGNTIMIDKNDERFINGDLKSIHKNKLIVKDKNDNYYQININDKRYINGDLTPIWKNRKHKESTKRKIGLKNSIKQKGKHNSQFGTCWILNEKLKENKKINKIDLDIWLNKGWKKGRKINF